MRAAALLLALAAAPAWAGGADVLKVEAVGRPGAFKFQVTVKSPDAGCSAYADWWEVLDGEGRLLYRRVLAHSHRDEQPFSRGGGPVPAGPDDQLWVRAHFRPGGYGGQALKGSVAGGFAPAVPPTGLGAALETAPPQPGGCAF